MLLFRDQISSAGVKYPVVMTSELRKKFFPFFGNRTLYPLLHAYSPNSLIHALISISDLYIMYVINNFKININ